MYVTCCVTVTPMSVAHCGNVMYYHMCLHDPLSLSHHTVVVAGIMCMSYTVLWLKLVSYVQVNYWCRQKRHKVKKMSELDYNLPSV